MPLMTAIDTCLKRGLIKPEALAPLENTLKEGMTSTFHLDIAMEAEFTFARRAVIAIDDGLGICAWPMELYWGNGIEQIELIKHKWDTKTEPFNLDGFSRFHEGVAMCIPNYGTARDRYEKSLSLRVELIKAVEQARSDTSNK